MINRQKKYVDLLECTNSMETPYTTCVPTPQEIFSSAHVRNQTDHDVRSAFVDTLKIQVETGAYSIDSSILAPCLQKAPIINALLRLKTAE
jgi:hypothetical protein